MHDLRMNVNELIEAAQEGIEKSELQFDPETKRYFDPELNLFYLPDDRRYFSSIFFLDCNLDFKLF